MNRFTLTMAAILILGVLALSGTSLLRAKASPRPAGASAAEAITLADVADHLPPDSWRAVPLTLPHDGVLEVEVGVTQGNPVNVFVTTPTDLQRMRGDDLNTVQPYPGFGATLTKQFTREGRLRAGTYYLVVHDPSSARLPASASNVSIQANLRP